jgi:hypothetical protein
VGFQPAVVLVGDFCACSGVPETAFSGITISFDKGSGREKGQVRNLPLPAFHAGLSDGPYPNGIRLNPSA